MQTAQYAEELLAMPYGPLAFGATTEDIKAMLEVRMDRQQILLSESVTIELTVLEAALTARVCSEGTLIQQLARIEELAGLRALKFAVVPRTARLPVFPLGAFTVYDNDLAVLESLAGEQQISDHESVATFNACFEAVSAKALRGEEAIHLVQAVAREVESHGKSRHSAKDRRD
jgi:hypothetical protein